MRTSIKVHSELGAYFMLCGNSGTMGKSVEEYLNMNILTKPIQDLARSG